MDTNSTTNSNDDQELAKVLEGMNQQVAGSAPAPTDDNTAAPVDGMAFEETSANGSAATTSSENSEDSFAGDAPLPTADPVAEPVIEPNYDPLATPASEPISESAPELVVAPGFGDSPELDSMKKSALEDLRPLVEKLDLPADEKFDTLLLLIRSTDDKSLLPAAHEAARSIADETKRAQALLDVIKEIDYFSGHGPQPV
ncbi:MAG: hypothetical protein ABIR46_01065 [Candidatus Saccharimonadales bacterium]